MLSIALKNLLDALFGAADGDWALIGGHAANLYRREIRTTVDVDILVPQVTASATGPLPRTAERLRVHPPKAPAPTRSGRARRCSPPNPRSRT